MAKRSFFDTNIFLYALLDFQGEQKHNTAVSLLSKNDQGFVSTQVINETCANIIRLSKPTEDFIRETITNFYSRHSVIVPSESTLLEASFLRSKYRLSFWDSTIIASALEAGADTLYTEDMQHNQIIENRLTIINPFIN